MRANPRDSLGGLRAHELEDSRSRSAPRVCGDSLGRWWESPTRAGGARGERERPRGDGRSGRRGKTHSAGAGLGAEPQARRLDGRCAFPGSRSLPSARRVERLHSSRVIFAIGRLPRSAGWEGERTRAMAVGVRPSGSRPGPASLERRDDRAFGARGGEVAVGRRRLRSLRPPLLHEHSQHPEQNAEQRCDGSADHYDHDHEEVCRAGQARIPILRAIASK